MQKKKLRFGRGLRVALGNRRSQAAEMVVPPGDAEGDEHEIRNTGRSLLRTLNVCVPPAYDAHGDELPRGKR